MRRNRLAALLLLPFVLSSCGSLDTLTGSGGSSSASASPAPSASPWIVVAAGSSAPAPSPSYPTTTPTTTFGGFLPLASVQPTPAPSATCPPGTYDFSRINVLAVTPGTTTAKVRFYNIGGYNLVQFRLTAISQHLMGGRQRDVGWVTINPTAGCGTVTATITGLTRKTGYIFSIDAVVTRRSGDGPRAATVFRSGVVYTI